MQDRYTFCTDSGRVGPRAPGAGAKPRPNLDGEKLINKLEIANPGHSTGYIPKYLHEQNVNVIISGGMGRRAIDLFNQFSIEPIVGITGTIDNCIKEILDGTLKGGESLCSPGGGKDYGVAKEDAGQFGHDQHHHHHDH